MSKRVLNAILTGVGITVFLGVVVLSGSLLSNIRDAFRRADTNKRPNQSLGVTKLDRGDSKSVRAVLIVTPQAWATLSAVKAIPGGTPEPSRDHKSSVPQNKKDGTKTSAGNH